MEATTPTKTTTANSLVDEGEMWRKQPYVWPACSIIYLEDRLHVLSNYGVV